ncbi:cell division protein SepF [Lysinibacillus louembei]|uniref:Cell division protein SepF n=1 Tax=Lysinibacillus louembei TaxID=1470088 RepID=A0ABZ0RZ01_9BACI|nr:cell division protein SepF [Lysinibacillus louembei]WPK12033.1 cell division protein SepF [Lysinibacillus louembei]
MSMKNKIKNFFYLDEEEEMEVAQQSTPKTSYEPPKQQEQPKPVVNNRVKKERKIQVHEEPAQVHAVNNVVSLQAAVSSKGSKVILIEPRVYAEAQDIAEHLKNKRATIVNLQRIDIDQGRRIIDFLSGTVYALGGDIQRVGVDIFLCTPDNVEVSGEISSYLEDI